MSEPYRKVIRAIRRRMFENGMNIRMTAEALGTHQITLGRYLNLRVSMPAELLIKAIYYFDIDLCTVLGIPHEVVV